MTINLDDLDTSPRPETRRDRWGRYLVVPPGGGKPVGYTRTTTVTKTLDDGGGLMPWKATATVVGAIRRRGLLAGWQALIAEHPDPWYSTPESKARCKELVEQCAEAGGSTDRADLGTALHALAERYDLTGQMPDIAVDSLRDDLAVYARTLEAAGIEVDRRCIEATVVLDEYRIAGMADRLRVHVPGEGWVCADLKTGADLRYSWEGIEQQLAIYTRADAIYRQGPATNGSEDERLPMPEVSQEVGLIIHLPAGEARCELHLIDLVSGWEGAQASMWVRARRARKITTRRLAVEPVVPARVPDGAPVELPVPEHAPRRLTIQARIDALRAFDPDAIEHLRREFAAAGLATLKQSDTHTAAELDAMEAIVARTEERYGPFNPPPAPPAPPAEPAPVVERRITREPPDEGPDLDDDTRAALRTAYEANEARRRWIGTLAADALRGGVPFNLTKGTPGSTRRFEIYRALMAAWDAIEGDDDVCRAAIAHVTGEEFARQPTIPLGACFGALSIDEARRLTGVLDAFADDGPPPVALVVDTPPPAAA